MCSWKPLENRLFLAHILMAVYGNYFSEQVVQASTICSSSCAFSSIHQFHANRGFTFNPHLIISPRHANWNFSSSSQQPWTLLKSSSRRSSDTLVSMRKSGQIENSQQNTFFPQWDIDVSLSSGNHLPSQGQLTRRSNGSYWRCYLHYNHHCSLRVRVISGETTEPWEPAYCFLQQSEERYHLIQKCGSSHQTWKKFTLLFHWSQKISNYPCHIGQSSCFSNPRPDDQSWSHHPHWRSQEHWCSASFSTPGSEAAGNVPSTSTDHPRSLDEWSQTSRENILIQKRKGKNLLRPQLSSYVPTAPCL